MEHVFGHQTRFNWFHLSLLLCTRWATTWYIEMVQFWWFVICTDKRRAYSLSAGLRSIMITDWLNDRWPLTSCHWVMYRTRRDSRRSRSRLSNFISRNMRNARPANQHNHLLQRYFCLALIIRPFIACSIYNIIPQGQAFNISVKVILTLDTYGIRENIIRPHLWQCVRLIHSLRTALSIVFWLIDWLIDW